MGVELGWKGGLALSWAEKMRFTLLLRGKDPGARLSCPLIPLNPLKNRLMSSPDNGLFSFCHPGTSGVHRFSTGENAVEAG